MEKILSDLKRYFEFSRNESKEYEDVISKRFHIPVELEVAIAKWQVDYDLFQNDNDSSLIISREFKEVSLGNSVSLNHSFDLKLHKHLNYCYKLYRREINLGLDYNNKLGVLHSIYVDETYEPQLKSQIEFDENVCNILEELGYDMLNYNQANYVIQDIFLEDVNYDFFGG